MLRDPNNPNHHKYVIVNKLQRKKERPKIFNLLPILKWDKTINDTENFRNLYDYTLVFFRHFIHYIYGKKLDYHYQKYSKVTFLNTPGCKIVWNDVHHTSYRVIKNGKFIRKCGEIQHFKVLQ